jgi:hypothetical protein
MIVVPLLGVASQSWPPQLNSVQWRFGVGGLMSGTLNSSAFGLLILLWLGFGTESRSALRAFLGLSVVGAVGTAALTAMFALDFMTLRQLVDGSAQEVFDRSGTMALASLVFMLCVLVAFIWAGVSTLRGLRKKQSRSRRSAELVTDRRADG